MKLTHDSPMPYGKHRGKMMCEIPGGLLMAHWSSGAIRPEVAEYILENQDEIKAEAKRELQERKRLKMQQP